MTPLLILVFLLFTTPVLAVPIDLITVVQTATEADFTIHFAGIPNFFTVDQFGRQQDSFQLYMFDTPQIDDNSLGPNIISLVRGSEIHWGNGLPVRDPLGLSDPHSGGWGPIRETDQFIQTGQTISFAESLQALGHTASTPFGYAYITGEFGASSSFFGACTSVAPCATPEPATGWSFLIGLGGIAALLARAEWGRRQP